MTVSTDLADMLYTELDDVEKQVSVLFKFYRSFMFVREYYSQLANEDMIVTVDEEQVSILGMIREDYDKIKAIKLLLDIEPTETDTPAATFSADDAKEHAASKVDVQDTAKPSGKPVQRRKVTKTTKAKGTRPTLRANVSDENIATIRKLVHEGYTYNELAAMFKISRGTVANIVKGVGCYKFDRDAEAE